MDALALSYAAPEALIKHCRRAAPRASSAIASNYDTSDIAELIQWLAEKDEFATHDEWVSLGMAIKLAFGDDGLDLWRISHDDTVTESVETSKWNSFATEPSSDRVTLASAMKRAHTLGWKGTIRASTQAMFAGTPKGAVPIMAGRGAAHLKLFAPILSGVPVLPRTDEHPTLPDIGHPLRDAINAAIPGIMANPIEYVIAHAVINLIHPQTAAKVWPVTPAVTSRTANLEAQEVQALAPDDWVREKEKIQGDNIDNVEFYMNGLGVEYRWNAWFEYPEIKGWKWSTWTRLDDRILAMLRMHATKKGTRFVMAKEFAADALLTLAAYNTVDPACALLDTWQAGWDGESRIDTWLCRACGVPDNAYYRAVSRTVLLGLVGRIRHPGIKFDLMMVLVSAKQGTEKSSLAKVLALNDEWFADNVSLGQESKELVLLLAGKTVGEVKEMRSRGDVEAAKAMIDTTHDEGRTAYARFTTKRARRNILIGSTNRPEFLTDDSGNRRFLPVHVVGRIDLGWVEEVLPQLIGEAATIACNGKKIELPREVWDIAAEYQEAARAQSDFEIHMSAWFGTEAPGFVKAHDLLSLLKDATGRAIQPNQYGAAMRRLGFESKVAHKIGRIWYRGEGREWLVSRQADGRMTVKQMFGSVESKVA
jgi:hypothetical protein